MKNKIKRFWDSKKGLIITFFSALAIIITVYILQNVTPFGGNSLLTIDFFHQYGPMLGELHNRLYNFSSLIYSFSMGMGLPFFRNFFNYLSSPFNIIILFFSYSKLLMSFSFIIGLKVVAAAIAMYYYLSKKFNYKEIYLVPVALLYAFGAWFTAYYWNIMWLDGIVFLPLIILGIERIINENKYLLYVISLVIMLFANYFMAYMICIFSVLYFITYLIIKTNHFDIKFILKKCLIFGFSSLLAGGICACFLIPMYYGLQSISATNDAFPISQYYSFQFYELLFKHFSGVTSTVLKSSISNAPNVSCGVLSIALFLLFYINPKIDLKRKIAYLLLLGILMFSFLYAPADFIWHGFHVPNDLPYRYSFLYSFVFIVMGSYGLYNIKYLKKYAVYIVYGIVLIGISCLYIFKYNGINSDMILLNFIVITICFLCYIIYIYYHKLKKFVPYILVLTISLECIISINNNWDVSQIVSTFYYDYNNVEDELKYIRKNDDSSMYRLEKTSVLTFNDPSWYNYYGQSTFSSMEYENLAVLEHNLGLPGNEINSFYYKQTTPVYDLMYNIKYVIGDNTDYSRYSLFYYKKQNIVYKFNYTLGLMYGVNNRIRKWNYELDNPFTVQNDFIQKAANTNDVVFSPLDLNNKEEVYGDEQHKIIKYTVKNPGDIIYLYFNSSNIDFLITDNTLYYSNDSYTYVNNINYPLNILSYVDFNEKYIINHNESEKNYTFYVGYNNYYSDNVLVYTINNNNFLKAYKTLSNNKVKLSKFSEDYIEGNINANDNMIIYTSIPYDDGWNVYVDNEKVDTFQVGNALLAFDITKGNHKIKLKYEIPKFNIGIIISITSIIILVGSVIIIKKRNK